MSSWCLLCFLTVCLHIVSGIPFLLLPLVPKSLIYCSSCCGLALVCALSSFIWTTFSLSGFMSALSSCSSVLNCSCHGILKFLCRHLLQSTLATLLSSLFIFHVSYLCSKTGTTSVLYSLSFVLLEMLLELRVFFNLNAALALKNPSFRSVTLSPSLQTVASK